MRGMQRQAALFAALLLAAGSAVAAGFGFLTDTPVGKFNDDDLKMMNAAIDRALAAEPLSVERWSNDRTGSSGEVSTQRAFEHGGRPCRDLRVVNRHKSQENSGIYTLCRDGSDWKLIP